MMHRLLGVVVVLAMVTLAGCSSADDPISSVNSPKDNGQVTGKTTEKFESTWTAGAYHPCTGEWVSGEVTDVITVTEHIKENGDRVVRFHINAKGTLVGAESGKTYQIKDAWIIREVNLNHSCPWSVDYNIMRTIVGSGNTNFRIKDSGKIVVDCDWNIKVQHFSFTAECLNE